MLKLWICPASHIRKVARAGGCKFVPASQWKSPNGLLILKDKSKLAESNVRTRFIVSHWREHVGSSMHCVCRCLRLLLNYCALHLDLWSLEAPVFEDVY